MRQAKLAVNAASDPATDALFQEGSLLRPKQKDMGGVGKFRPGMDTSTVVHFLSAFLLVLIIFAT